jgi:hypothetical protein
VQRQGRALDAQNAGRRAYLAAGDPANITSGHASNDSVLLPDGTIVFACTSSELPDKYFGAIRIYISHDDGETFEQGPILFAEDGNLIREPALCLRPNGVIRLFSRTCPGTSVGAVRVTTVYPAILAKAADGGKTWTKPVPSGISTTSPRST